MLFGATTACPRCPARFPARDRCPRCGGAELFDLSRSRKQRDAFRRRAREIHGGGRRTGLGWVVALAHVAEWMPERPWLVRLIGVLMTLPAAGMLLDPTFGRHLWFWHDAQGNMGSYHEGLTEGGFTMLLLGAAGILLVASSFLRRLSATVAGRVARVQGGRPTLVSPDPPAGDAVSMRGVVRGEPGKTALLAGERCIAFGLSGDVDGTKIEDAEGGDFELVTATGERVLVRPRQAIWKVTPAPEPAPTERTAEIDRWLEQRGIGGAGACTLAESILRDGDEVTVSGKRGKGKRAPGTYRDEPITTLEGTADRPLVIQKG